MIVHFSQDILNILSLKDIPNNKKSNKSPNYQLKNC